MVNDIEFSKMMIAQKNLFSKDECNIIISLIKSNEKRWKSNDREYTSYAINLSNDTKWIFDKLSEYFQSETRIELLKVKEQIHFHIFEKGDLFEKHNDIRDYRMYAVGVLLNDDFEGGDFKIYNPTEITLDKLTGNTYIFDVRLMHEITPILTGERYSLIWFLQKEHIKILTNKII